MPAPTDAEDIETNVASFLMEMGRAGGGTPRDDADITWTVGGSPIDYHNAVVRCSTNLPHRAEALAREFLEELRRRSLPGSWHVHPGMTPGLVPILLDVGFDDGGPEPAMSMALDGEPLPESAEGLRIERVRDAAGLSHYREVLADGFGEGPAEADWVSSIWEAIGLDTTSWTHYVATVRDEPVSAATVHRTGHVAGVYFVATRPDFRRRGFGAAVTARAVNDAKGHGARTAVLGSSPMGRRVYERLGFRERFTYRILEWSP